MALKRPLQTALSILILSGTLTCATFAAAGKGPPPVSPHWVFDHWVWEDDVNTEAALWELIDGYTSRGIPVGAVIIDSPWTTEYNNFVFNRELYPDPEGMIKKLHARGIKAILWMTSMINNEYPKGEKEPWGTETYEEALEKGYLINNGETYKWWKGRGAFVDYTNPEALEWWHGLMDRALDLGYDGWKLDGTDAHFPSKGHGYAGEITAPDYRRMYYSDSYAYTVSKNPEAVTLPRSVDIIAAVPDGFSPVTHTPASWVGDEKHDWGAWGILEALDDVLNAARLGYGVVGSDIAGYHGDDPITKELLLRWAQWGAFCPLMENGGHGAHQPWLHDEETVEIYRKFVKIHLELKPYLYSMMWKSHLGGAPIIQPRGGRYQYMLGGALLVAAIYEPNNTRSVKLPEGNWIDYWDNSKVYPGKTTLNYEAPLDRYPVFIREGAIIPLEIADAETGHSDESLAGDESLADAVTLDIYPAEISRKFTFYDYRDSGAAPAEISMAGSPGLLEITIAPAARKFILRILSPEEPKEVTINGEVKTARWDKNDSRLWVEPGVVEAARVKIKY